MPDNNLLNRCIEFVGNVNREAHFGEARPVQDLEAFVLSEIGRAASEKLADSHALVLFFASGEGRKTITDAIMEAYPGLVSRSWP